MDLLILHFSPHHTCNSLTCLAWPFFGRAIVSVDVRVFSQQFSSEKGLIVRRAVL